MSPRRRSCRWARRRPCRRRYSGASSPSPRPSQVDAGTSPRRRSRGRRSRWPRCGCSRATAGRQPRRLLVHGRAVADGVSSRRHLLEGGAELGPSNFSTMRRRFGLSAADKTAGSAARGGTITIPSPFRQRAVWPAPRVAVCRSSPLAPTGRSSLCHETCDSVRPAVHFDAELGAQVGDDGGGSADDKFGDWGLGDLRISDC